MYKGYKLLYNSKIDTLVALLKNKDENFWLKRGEIMALSLFEKMTKRVPAYKDFLKKNKINPKLVKKIEDLKNIPIVNKDNYLRYYPLEKLCWDGKLGSKHYVYSTTSGTTGKPMYFPRGDFQDKMYSVLAELYLVNNFQIDKKKTLYIDAFAMGPWIGGLFTYQAIKNINIKGAYKLSVITTGVNKQSIIDAIKQLGNNYDQIIIGGYPPFIKDVIDYGDEQGIQWLKYNFGLIFSAESITENFRDHLSERIGIKNYYIHTLNHYGTVDQGTHGYETPLAILIRRIANADRNFFNQLFGTSEQLPTIVQYFPEQYFFERNEDSLISTSYSGIPLVRYDLKDLGGVYKFSDLNSIVEENKLNLNKEKFFPSINRLIWKIPFVYLYERMDMIVSFYGANIYPEHIRECGYAKKISSLLTGKFTMKVSYNNKFNQELHIYYELKNIAVANSTIKNYITKLVFNNLVLKNSEYKNNYKVLGKKIIPKVYLLKYNSAPYFNTIGKHKWSINTK